MVKIFVTAILSMLLVACGGGSTSDEPVPEKREAPFLNLKETNVVRTIDELSFQLEVVTNSDATITYMSLDESIAVVSDSGLITFVAIGSTKLIVGLQSTEQYLELSKEVTLDINGISPDLSSNSSVTSKKFGDLPFVIESSSLSPAQKTYSSSNVQVATIDSVGSVDIKGAGNTVLRIEQAAAEDYSGGHLDITLDVAKQETLIIASDASLEKTIDDLPFKVEFTSNNPSPAIYTSDNTSVATVDESDLISIINPGSAGIYIQQNATNNYLNASYWVPINVSKAETQLSKTAVLSNVRFEDGLSLLGVIDSNSDGILSITSLTPSLMLVDGDRLKILGAGSISFRVDATETSRYLSASQEFSFDVEKGDGFLNIQDLKPMVVGEVQTISVSTHDDVGVDVSVLTTELISISGENNLKANASGNARILLNTKESANYNTVQEELSVMVIPNDLLGVDLYESSSKFRVNDLTTALELLYSSSDTCDPLSIESCADYQVISLDTTPLGISTMSQSTKGYVWLRTESGDLTERSVVDSEADYGHFSARYGHQVVSFNGAYWLTGGSVKNEPNSSDIWKSNDGYFWELITDSAPFGQRAFHQVVEFKGELYLIGGIGSEGKLSDVWKSSDGENWNLVTSDGGFGARYYHQVSVHRGSLILVGGKNTSNHNTRDVWSSLDGETWQLLNNAGSFNSLYGHQMVSFGSYLWLIGGYGGSYTHEIWKSYDGTSWASVTNPSYPDFPSLALFQVVATDSNIWVFPDQYVSEIWTCCSWNRVSTTVAFPLRPDYQAVESLDSGFLFIGGGSYSKRYQDVWSRYYQLKPVRFSFH